MKKLIMSVVAIATLSTTGANANELQEFFYQKSVLPKSYF